MGKLIFITLLLFAKESFAQIKIGDKAPAINVTDWIQNQPENTSLDNKFRIIDFWATWCAPCLASMAHMNRLVEEIGAKDNLIFLAMSDERKEKISPILSRVAFKACVVTDTTQQTQMGFAINDIPYCIIVDDKGAVQWTGNPAELTNEIIKSILTRKDFAVIDNNKIAPTPLEKLYDSLQHRYRSIFNNDSVKEYFSLAPFLKEGYGSKSAFNSISSLRKMEIGVKLKDIISEHVSISGSQISLPSELENVYASYCYKSESRLKSGDVLNSILTTAKLTYNKSDSIQKVYLLEVSDSKLLNQNIAKNKTGLSHVSVSDDGRYIAMSNSSLQRIIAALQDRFGCPIIIKDSSVFEKRLDIMLQTDNFTTLKKSLKIYGISIREVKQVLPFVKVIHKENSETKLPPTAVLQ
jgi:thiol-disulfide isomerase/thioredoxin